MISRGTAALSTESIRAGRVASNIPRRFNSKSEMRVGDACNSATVVPLARKTSGTIVLSVSSVMSVRHSSRFAG